VSGGQLAFGLHPEEFGESIELDDVDVDHADRLTLAERRRLVERLLAESARPRPCRCVPGPLVLDEPRCARCGRTVG
jgi:hypothetical protein